MVRCRGPCGASYHRACVGEVTADDAGWKCGDCVAGLHPCFICKTVTAADSQLGPARSEVFPHYVYNLVPRSQYTSGKGSSAVGLTAYVTKVG